MYHGAQSVERACEASFRCKVCRFWRDPTTLSVAFRNDNNPLDSKGKVKWDRTCVDCAPVYLIPVLTSVVARPSTVIARPLPESNSVSDATAQAHTSLFKTADAMGISKAEAEKILAEHDGNVVAANDRIVSLVLGTTADGSIPDAPVARRDPLADRITSKPQPERPTLNNDAARAGAADIFLLHVEPLLPRPQTDGSLRAGDLKLLNALMEAPVLLAPPMAERTAEACRPPTGWTPESKLQVSPNPNPNPKPKPNPNPHPNPNPNPNPNTNPAPSPNPNR